MTDKYIEKQLKHYENAPVEAAKDDALYRLGTYLEVIPCGNENLTTEQRDNILETANKAVNQPKN
jgi:hypothetical protein